MEDSGKSSVEALLDRDEFARKLHELRVPNALIDEAWMIVKGCALGVLLYGSWARRQAGAFSDLDLLLLSDVRAGTRKSDRVSVAFYSSTQLGDACLTLYGMHLARDGVILHDDTGALARILSTFSPPDPTDLLRRVREFAIILDVTDEDRSRYLPGLGWHRSHDTCCERPRMRWHSGTATPVFRSTSSLSGSTSLSWRPCSHHIPVYIQNRLLRFSLTSLNA